ncbi:hypothetical protein Pan153_45720 [Gimesia panareensis]|uniref:Uncharacterized protein n=1 Tax=Gimesia panareensis TaxID=2527978 RepID=A0A518FU86_9PLAN|nr:DUF4175 family protein [Gimesia panareensis]QDV19903.1 hypothetical protein Pan153_45720 [Gimesia panareensis]
MPHSIRAQLEQLHQKIQQLIWLNGICWGLTILLSLALLAIALDWSLDITDPVIRLILALGIGAALIWTTWKHLLVPLQTPVTDLDLALKIEKRYPALKDSFSSSIEFDSQPAAHYAGSAQMRQTVIQQSYQQAAQINFLELIDTHPIRKIMFSAAFLCLLLAGISILHPRQMMLGFHRLMLPFSAPQWPQSVELQILDENLIPIETSPGNPYQVVEGQTFQFFVENRKGAPPEDLRLEYQTSQKAQLRPQIYSEPLRLVSVPDSATGVDRDLGTGSLVVSSKTVKLRAAGGDDTNMPWLIIQSVPPTTIQLEKVTLTPPEYSQQPKTSLPSGVGHFKALVGTRIEVTASSNKLLKSVALRVKDQQPQPVKLDIDRKHFTTEFVITEPGTYSYWFDIENDQSFRPPSPDRYEVTGMTDAVPEVFLEKPDTDLQVTPAAQIPLTVAIRDDLAIASALIRYQKSSREESLSRALRTDRPSETFPLRFTVQKPATELVINQNWNLAELPLAEGDRIIFRAEATDFFQSAELAANDASSLTATHTGSSISRVLTIVSPTYKSNELVNRHAQLLEELTRVLKDQRLLNTEIKDVQHQLERVGQVRSQELDTIKQVEMDQKRVASQLSSPRTGLEQRARELLQELKWNRIQDPGMQQRLSELSTELSRLNQDIFPQIQEQMTQARKKLQSSVDSKTETSPTKDEKPDPANQTSAEKTRPSKSNRDTEPLEALTAAERGQRQVIDRLDKMLQSLSEWQKTRDLVSELEEQIAQQSEIQDQTAELAKRTITRSFSNLNLQDQADLEKLASRQERQSDNFKSFRDLLDNMQSQTRENSGTDQFQKQAAIDFLRKKSLPEKMQQTADRLKQNQVGQAIQEQQQIQESMQQLKDIFENQSSDSPDQLIKKLKQSEQELSQLKQKQQDLLQKLKSASKGSDQTELKKQLQQLAKQEQQLQQQLKQFEDQLQKLSLNRASESVRRASQRLSKVNDALDQGQTQQAEQEMNESLDDLEQAHRELASRRQELEETLAFEEFTKLESEIESLIERQQAVITETTRLEELRLERGRWSRGQLKSLKQLSETEQDLQSQTEAFVEKMAAAPVFVLAIQKVRDQLEIAVARLQQRLTDQETLTAENRAQSKLKEILQILKQRKSLQQGESEEGEPTLQPPQDQIPLIAQLRLLKLMQEELLLQTTRFNESISQKKELTPAQQEHRKLLAEDQADLAELSRELMSLLNGSESDDTKQLPEIKK